MKERILLIGEEPALLATRASLLSEWETTIAYSWEAIETLQEDRFDLVIISQSVPVERTQEFIRVASTLHATPQVLAIRYPGGRHDLGVETREVDLMEGPAWLGRRVAAMFSQRASGI